MDEIKILSEKKHITSGEVYCRPKGGNLYWTGYSLNYSEVFTQLGGGSDNLPVSVSIDNEGNYKIFVPTPSGTLVSKIETTRSESGCNKENPPTNDAQSMPEQKLMHRVLMLQENGCKKPGYFIRLYNYT